MDHETQADELRQFANLRDEGVISENEFQAKKAQLLGLAGSAQPVVVTPAVYEVVLHHGGPKPLEAIKVVRGTLGLGLKQAVDLVDSTKAAPVPITTFDTHYQAELLERRFTEAGAGVTIEIR